MKNLMTLNPIIATLRHWFSWDFKVLQREQFITELDLSVWREKATFKMDGYEYKVSTENT
jgi:hypothetical protein